MSSQILINSSVHETRVALVEKQSLAEIYIDRSRDQGIVGNIYKGKVNRVLPGMQAAFVDIGLDRAAFLYVSDVYEDFEDELHFLLPHVEEDDEVMEVLPKIRTNKSKHAPAIEDLLREGQKILVQVAKDPLGTKGARITSHISLPGRYLVIMPMMDRVGVSRRIENEKERVRLRDFIQQTKPKGIGFIVRTVSEGINEKQLRQDMDYLMKLWKGIQRKKEKASAPSLIHEDLSLALRVIRDLYTSEVSKIIVDSKSEHKKIQSFLRSFLPRSRKVLDLYQGEEPLFDVHGVEIEINRALGRKIWLKSGGYLTIDQTEALSAIDINTGRFVGKRNLEETIFKTNLEAVKEIVAQLRLRNIGGIIVIDFIDMEKENNRERVYKALEEALRHDRAKTNILKISGLGLVEMTRKRTRENITQALCEPCSYCDGKGYIRSKESVSYEIFREIQRVAAKSTVKKLTVFAHQEVAKSILEEEQDGLKILEKELKKTITIKSKNHFHHEQFEVKTGM